MTVDKHSWHNYVGIGVQGSQTRMPQSMTVFFPEIIAFFFRYGENTSSYKAHVQLALDLDPDTPFHEFKNLR